jgi:hypothetical protein
LQKSEVEKILGCPIEKPHETAAAGDQKCAKSSFERINTRPL